MSERPVVARGVPEGVKARDFFALNLVPFIWQQWLPQCQASGLPLTNEFMAREAYALADTLLLVGAEKGTKS